MAGSDMVRADITLDIRVSDNPSENEAANMLMAPLFQSKCRRFGAILSIQIADFGATFVNFIKGMRS